MNVEDSFDIIMKGVAFQEDRKKSPVISGFDFRNCKMRVICRDYSGVIFENCDLRGADFKGCTFGGTQIGPDCKIEGCMIPLEAALEITWFKNQPAVPGK